MRGSQVQDAGDLSLYPRVQAEVFTVRRNTWPGLWLSEAVLRDTGLHHRMKGLLLLATCTLGMQVQCQVYLHEEFEDRGKRPGWGQGVPGSPPSCGGWRGWVRNDQVLLAPCQSPASVVCSSNFCPFLVVTLSVFHFPSL